MPSYLIKQHYDLCLSILGPILFNIYLYDMFFMIDNIDIASYADDNTPYRVGKKPM